MSIRDKNVETGRVDKKIVSTDSSFLLIPQIILYSEKTRKKEMEKINVNKRMWQRKRGRRKRRRERKEVKLRSFFSCSFFTRFLSLISFSTHSALLLHTSFFLHHFLHSTTFSLVFLSSIFSLFLSESFSSPSFCRSSILTRT